MVWFLTYCLLSLFKFEHHINKQKNNNPGKHKFDGMQICFRMIIKCICLFIRRLNISKMKEIHILQTMICPKTNVTSPKIWMFPRQSGFRKINRLSLKKTTNIFPALIITSRTDNLSCRNERRKLPAWKSWRERISKQKPKKIVFEKFGLKFFRKEIIIIK